MSLRYAFRHTREIPKASIQAMEYSDDTTASSSVTQGPEDVFETEYAESPHVLLFNNAVTDLQYDAALRYFNNFRDREYAYPDLVANIRVFDNKNMQFDIKCDEELLYKANMRIVSDSEFRFGIVGGLRPSIPGNIQYHLEHSSEPQYNRPFVDIHVQRGNTVKLVHIENRQGTDETVLTPRVTVVNPVRELQYIEKVEELPEAQGDAEWDAIFH